MASGEKRETSYYEVALTNRQVVGAFVILLVGLMVSFLAGVLVGRDNDASAQSTLRLARTEPAPAQPAPQPAEPVPAPLEGVEKLDFFAADGAGSAPIGGAPTTEDAPSPSPATGADAHTPPSAPAAASPGGDDVPVPRAVPASGAGDDSGAVPKWRRRGQVAREAEELENQFASEEAELVDAPATAEGASPDSPAPAGPKVGTKTPSPPARLAEREPAPTVAKGAFMVQVFSSSDAAKARGMLDSLKDAGYPAMLLRNEQVTPAMYRVRVGPYRDRPAAAKVAEELRTRLRVDTWITAE